MEDPKSRPRDASSQDANLPVDDNETISIGPYLGLAPCLRHFETESTQR
jgi:hypothetical protein